MSLESNGIFSRNGLKPPSVEVARFLHLAQLVLWILILSYCRAIFFLKFRPVHFLTIQKEFIELLHAVHRLPNKNYHYSEIKIFQKYKISVQSVFCICHHYLPCQHYAQWPVTVSNHLLFGFVLCTTVPLLEKQYHQLALVSIVVNLRVPQSRGIYWLAERSVDINKSTLLFRVSSSSSSFSRNSVLAPGFNTQLVHVYVDHLLISQPFVSVSLYIFSAYLHVPIVSM